MGEHDDGARAAAKARGAALLRESLAELDAAADALDIRDKYGERQFSQATMVRLCAATLLNLHAEVERLRAAVEERESDMHVRIRAGYDKTVADAWRARLAEVEAERDEARAEAKRLREQMDAEREGFNAFAELQRVKLAAARAEVARLRRLALVPMAPGEVPTEAGWYAVQIDGGSVEVVDVYRHDVDGLICVSDWGHHPVVGMRGRIEAWLAHIPVEALSEVADGRPTPVAGLTSRAFHPNCPAWGEIRHDATGRRLVYLRTEAALGPALTALSRADWTVALPILNPDCRRALDEAREVDGVLDG